MDPARDLALLEFDPDRSALSEPREVRGPRDVPRRTVLCFFQDVIDTAVRAHGGRSVGRLRSEIGSNPIYTIDARAGGSDPT